MMRRHFGTWCWSVLALLFVGLTAAMLTAKPSVPRLENSPVFQASLEKKEQDWRARPNESPMLAAAGNPNFALLGFSLGASACIGSACWWSLCIGSACGGSGCGGSGCIESGCAGSLCVASHCAGSACTGSHCYGSACRDQPCGPPPDPEKVKEEREKMIQKVDDMQDQLNDIRRMLQQEGVR